MGGSTLAMTWMILPCLAPPADGSRVTLVTDRQDSPAVKSLRTLWKDRLVVGGAPSGDGLAIVLEGDVRPWLEAGAAVVADLPLFARFVGGRVNEVTMENPNRLPIDPYDIKSIEAAGREFAEYRSKGRPLGETTKAIRVFVGMLHAEDEWMPSLGLLSLAELLGRSKDLPEVKARLERFSVKIYPLIHPSVYEAPLAEPGRPREGDRIDLEKTRQDRVYSLTQFHQGGDVLVPACRTPMALGRAVADRARRDFAGRHVWWWWIGGRYGPQEWEARAPCAEMPPSWSVYWWQDGRTSCYGLYPHDVAFSARAMYFVEQEFILLMPERFTQANAHHALHCMMFEHGSVASLLLSDQTANWGMSLLRTDHGGLDRDRAWRPATR